MYTRIRGYFNKSISSNKYTVEIKLIKINAKNRMYL